MCKKYSQSTQKSTISSESRPITLNNNPDAWLIDYAKTVLNLTAQKEAVQYTDGLMGKNEARNHCIADAAYAKSQELNQTINSEIAQMAQFQAYTMAGLQAKAQVLKTTVEPLSHDEGFISYETSMLLTSLLMDILGGVKHD